MNLVRSLCVALIILLISGCAQLQVETPIAVNPSPQTADWSKKWWLPRHQEKIAQKESMAQVDLVFLGDSITHFWDGGAKDIWTQYYGNRNALNLGFSGDRTEHVLWRLNNGAIDNVEPRVVVLMIGTNNTGHRRDKPKDTAAGIKKILETLKDNLPETKILLLAIFPRGATSNDPLRQINDQTNLIIKNFHDGKQIHYLDINHLFLDSNGVLSRDVMHDLLHPNKNQYPLWAEAIEPFLQNWLPR